MEPVIWRAPRRSVMILLTATFVAFSTTAQGAESATEPNDRIRSLEAENASIREELDEQRARLDELAEREAPEAEAAAQAEPATETEPASVDAEDGFFNVKGKVPISISGFIKGDMLWNDSRLNSTSAPRFVRSEPNGGRNDDQYTATVQHSRLIAKIGDIELSENAKLRAHGEMDFFNLSDTGDTNFNNNQLRVRQLYTELEISGWKILMGQAWDLFSPLNVGTLNTNGNHWFGGNAGFRRPQVRVTKDLMPADGHKISLAGSVNANVGVTVTDSGRTLNSGRDSGIPVLEGRVEYSFPGWAAPIKVGASGLWGEEDIDGVRNNVDQWAVGGHAVVPVTSWLDARGEYQHGKNTDAFLFGGGVSTTTGTSVESDAAWVQLTAKATDELTITAIAGLDNPKNSDLSSGAVKSNRVIGGNVKYKVFKPLTFGIEYQHFATRYTGASNESANMVWLSAIFNF